MTEAQKVVEALLESEPESHTKTRHRIRARAQQEMTDHYFRLFGTSFGQSNEDKGQDVGFTSGSRKFERTDGVWYEIKKTKNPAYWDRPSYFWIAPGPDNMAFIVVKKPMRLTSKLWHRACAQIWRDAAGLSWYKDHPAVDNADEGTWTARATGKKPEPAYEIFADGTWKRIK